MSLSKLQSLKQSTINGLERTTLGTNVDVRTSRNPEDLIINIVAHQFEATYFYIIMSLSEVNLI